MELRTKHNARHRANKHSDSHPFTLPVSEDSCHIPSFPRLRIPQSSPIYCATSFQILTILYLVQLQPHLSQLHVHNRSLKSIIVPQFLE